MTSIELRTVKRTMSYRCIDHKATLASITSVEIKKEISNVVQEQLQIHSTEISSKLETFLITIKESNVELVKFKPITDSL